MQAKHTKAFTMLELTFAIVIIGILSAVAVPRMAVTRDDAIITKARATVAAVRNSISTERQRRILQGNFTAISDLAGDGTVDTPIFDLFEDNATAVLEYPLRACATAASTGCWVSTANNTYNYTMPDTGNVVPFTLANSRFTCADDILGDCRLLSE